MATEIRAIRPATLKDLPAIIQVIDAARLIMRRNGDMAQWNDGYPSDAMSFLIFIGMAHLSS